MKVAVFGTTVQAEFLPVLRQFFRFLADNRVEVEIFRPFYQSLITEMNFTPKVDYFFDSHLDFNGSVDYLFSIGGDGTFLQSFLNTRNYHIPLVGVNTGRLGFLADISQEYVIDAMTDILEGRFCIIERTLLEVELKGASNFEFNYALNEMTVLKTDSSSMINIHARIPEFVLGRRADYCHTHRFNGIFPECGRPDSFTGFRKLCNQRHCTA